MLRLAVAACFAVAMAGCATSPEPAPAAAPVPVAVTIEKPAPRAVDPAGRDLVDLSAAAMRLQEQINRNLPEYQKRPRKKFIGGRPAESRFEAYEQAWRQKVEGMPFPPEARGKRGNLRITVTIRADGRLATVELDRSSGDKDLDRAMTNLVRGAAPFAPFPEEISRDTDELVITRTWFVGPPQTATP